MAGRLRGLLPEAGGACCSLTTNPCASHQPFPLICAGGKGLCRQPRAKGDKEVAGNGFCTGQAVMVCTVGLI